MQIKNICPDAEIQTKIQKLANYATNNGNINIKELMQLKIPIPPMEKQLEIVEYLDFIYEKSNKTSNDKISELKMLNQYYLKNQEIEIYDVPKFEDTLSNVLHLHMLIYSGLFEEAKDFVESNYDRATDTVKKN